MRLRIHPFSQLPLGWLFDEMQGQKDESRKEYQTFFSLWKDGDADGAVLRQAHLEYAALQK